MIRFFRRIRQQFLSENKFSKYLFYAIGEIVLVVLGILIALQINDWNEKRKSKLVETELLRQFQVELNSDIAAIEHTLEVYQKANNSCAVLIRHLKNNGAYHDTLNYHFAVWNDYEHFNINNGAISNLNSRGVEIISDADLRNQILKLYNQTYSYSKDIGGFYREDLVQFVYPVYLKKVEPVSWGKMAIPNDYDALLKDTEFMNQLQWIKNATGHNMDVYREALAEIRQIINAIEKELE
ncbi:DUF6090 family protein [Robiginitalea sp. IMCC44478]|uniref:DUF6090 family protein n=1 Tax=Robiginitalea sp. IMCC44478 TaxID=3459122 RepID=UPI004041A994